MRCFPSLPSTSVTTTNHPIIDWIANAGSVEDELSEPEQHALARVIPLLLCGEQSASFVFGQENERLSAENVHLADLKQIEQDELIHERGLQFLHERLPLPEDLNRIKRQSQIFYGAISKQTNNLATHFLLISELDACVCKVLNHVGSSSLKNTAIGELFTLIKKDEARHVLIAKRHAQTLGAASTNEYSVGSSLVELLQTQHQAFLTLQIDAEELYRQILITHRERKVTQTTHDL